MPPSRPSPKPLSRTQVDLIAAVRDSGAIDFEKLGQSVKDIAPVIFADAALNDPSTVATDAIVWGVSSVAHVYKAMDIGLEVPEVIDEIRHR